MKRRIITFLAFPVLTFIFLVGWFLYTFESATLKNKKKQAENTPFQIMVQEEDIT